MAALRERGLWIDEVGQRLPLLLTGGRLLAWCAVPLDGSLTD